MAPTRLRPMVADHSLVRLPWGTTVPSNRLDGVDKTTMALYRLLADTGDRPMPVMELAARLNLPRVVAVTIITDLAWRQLAEVSNTVLPVPFFNRTPEQTTGAFGLASAKVTVTGPHGAGTSTYVGAVSDWVPVRTVETIHADGDLVSLSLELGALDITPDSRLHLLAAPAPDVYDALWPGVIREAMGALVMVHPTRPGEARPTLWAVQDTGVPFQIVVNHVDGTTPDPDLIASTLDVGPEQISVIDVRSRPATRSVLHQFLRYLEAL